jgi:hypothetical protein
MASSSAGSVAELVRFADIERTELLDDKGQLWLHLRGGRTVRLGAKNEPDLAGAMASLRSLEGRIREMRAASDSGQASPLGARTAPPREWIRSLRGALDKGAPGFRVRALVPEELWRAVENARLSATARAAAAIALGPTLDEQGKARLGIAANASADPKLRVLFGALTDNDEDAIEGALVEIEAMDSGKDTQRPAHASAVLALQRSSRRGARAGSDEGGERARKGACIRLLRNGHI